jgi:hypothetical protein
LILSITCGWLASPPGGTIVTVPSPAIAID